MMPHSKPLRDELRGAVNQREAALRNGRNHRKDMDRLRAAIGRVQSFLSSYPVADDGRVRQWCASHADDVRMVVTGNSRMTIEKLIRP